MKKISLLLLIIAMVFSILGCHASKPVSKQECFCLTYNGVQIILNSEAAPIIAALGEPKSYTQEPSCAFDGMDKTYYYGSIYLSTYPLGGKDYVQRIWFADDTVATEEGIRIGDSQAEVEKAYGADYFNGGNAYIITKGASRLTVILTDAAVSSIQFEAIVE